MTENIVVYQKNIFNFESSFFFFSDLLLGKSMDWFLYDNGLRHERLKDN